MFSRVSRMDDNDTVSFKIYLIRPNQTEPEIRRFGLKVSVVTVFDLFAFELSKKFPELSENNFRIFWKDEEGDEVAVSSNEELILALTSMKSDVKKFFVKMEPHMSRSQHERKNKTLHPNIYCDGCESNILGFRYKCIICDDYDLCEVCEKAGVHADHVMLRIPEPWLFRRSSLQKLTHYFESFMARNKHRDRKHGHEGCLDDGYPESHKKHKKCDRRESETGDESEEGCHRKHFHHMHKKMKKGKCPYSSMMNDVLTYLSPRHLNLDDLQGAGDESKKQTKEEFSHSKYLKTLGMTLQKFLDPLGVDVDFEVRPGNEKKEDKKTEEPAKQTPPPSTSSSPQKEVRFADKEEVTKEKVDEIAKRLAKQTMNDNSTSSSISKASDNDDWVDLEELEKDCEDSQPNTSTGAIPKPSQAQEKVSAEKKKEQEVPKAPQGSKAKEGQNLYPNLNGVETDPAMRNALEQLLSMGFSNENNLLTFLLEAKKGNIGQALELLLDQQKKN